MYYRKLSRELRNNATDAERLLWQHLRMRQMGNFKFRRQHPIGNYIVDFICLQEKLVIELDGGQHNEEEAIAADLIRTGVFGTMMSSQIWMGSMRLFGMNWELITPSLTLPLKEGRGPRKEKKQKNKTKINL